ncbi:MAG: RluA family pseudouridine synthase [Clostridiales Family XIII bacterium]|jgi:23S rRNA pseudouridine955/2504/2580 synthase|nr:RluA family pseudouridine synthase [Clostridiales Family XIII bacterium]
METIAITANEAGQRLDRFLKKYLRAAPLSLVYRLVRKDVKVNGMRRGIDYMLEEGDEIALYLDGARIDELARRDAASAGRAYGAGFRRRPKIQFKVCYEDGNILAVSKPYGLLTHGDGREKKDTLVNQVVGYLTDRGEYDPSAERLFTPSPTGRLDRNTTGLVVFGKNSKAVRDFSRMVASEDAVEKYYLALVFGAIEEELTLEGSILKDEEKNRVKVIEANDDKNPAKPSLTIVRPLGISRGADVRYTLVEVNLVTGRPHQIRAHLAAEGYPIAGDPKYGDRSRNRRFTQRFGITSQFLHAHKIIVKKGGGSLEYLTGAIMESSLPQRLVEITETLGVSI